MKLRLLSMAGLVALSGACLVVGCGSEDDAAPTDEAGAGGKSGGTSGGSGGKAGAAGNAGKGGEGNVGGGEENYAGEGGEGGEAGSAVVGGNGGTGGSGGSSGSSGTGGSTAGSGGSTAGSGGTSGTAGSAGKAGSSGTGGTAGSGGTSGTSGSGGSTAGSGGSTAGTGGSTAGSGGTGGAAAGSGGTGGASGGTGGSGGSGGAGGATTTVIALSTYQPNPPAAPGTITYDATTLTVTAVNTEYIQFALPRTVSSGQTVVVHVTGTRPASATVGFRSWLVVGTGNQNPLSNIAPFFNTTLPAESFTLDYTLTATGTAAALFFKGPVSGTNLDNVTFATISVTL